MTWLYGSAQDSVHSLNYKHHCSDNSSFKKLQLSSWVIALLLLHSSKKIEVFGLAYRQLPPVLDTWLHSEAPNAVWNRLSDLIG